MLKMNVIVMMTTDLRDFQGELIQLLELKSVIVSPKSTHALRSPQGHKLRAQHRADFLPRKIYN